MNSRTKLNSKCIIFSEEAIKKVPLGGPRNELFLKNEKDRNITIKEQMGLIRNLRNSTVGQSNAEKCRFKAAAFGQGTRHIKNIIYWQRIQ